MYIMPSQARLQRHEELALVRVLAAVGHASEHDSEGSSPWNTFNFKGQFGTKISNGSGIRDPPFDILRTGCMRSDRSEEGLIRLETLIVLKFVNPSCSSYPLFEIRQTVPCNKNKRACKSLRMFILMLK